nr:SsgA family sporulation/cell division regulator [Streptomyces sp. SID7803]
MHTVVERELELKLVLSPERSIPVPARLTYRTEDPYAVHITFHITSDSPVYWTFARDLLVEGVFRPCGQGDVRIWPTKVDGNSVICVALTSPDGNALLEVPSAAVAVW